MKKLTLIVARDDEHGGQFETSAWALDVPGLAAWNQPGKFMDVVIKRAWQLMHIPSGTMIEAAYKRDHIVGLADAVRHIDWDRELVDIPSTDLASAVYAIREWWEHHDELHREAA